MKLLPLHKLGAREISAGVIDFGLFLPWVSASDGNRLWVKVIHEKDQFLQAIQPLRFELNHSVDLDYGDYWSVQVNIDSTPKPDTRSAWGSPGRYVYLIKLRRTHPQFRYGEHFFYNHHDRYQSKGLMLFSRRYGDNFSLIALNFSDQEQTVPFAFPFGGDYREELHGHENLKDIVCEEQSWLTVPSNYGRIWTLQ